MASRSSDSNNVSEEPSDSGTESTLSIEEALNDLMNIDGALGAAVVDYDNGMTLGTVGGQDLDMELAGAGTTEVIRSERDVISDLDIGEEVEDVLISLEGQYHLIRICQHHENVFIYLVMGRRQGNLGLARRSIDQVDERLELT